MMTAPSAWVTRQAGTVLDDRKVSEVNRVIGGTVPASLSSSAATLVDQLGDIDSVGGLRERLAMVPDPRSTRGLRHSLMSILLITVCALSAGKDGYTAIEAWANDAPPAVLEALDVRFDPFLARHVCPDESTIRTTIGRVNPDDLAATGCRYLADLAEGRATVRRDVADEREARRARTAAAASPDTGGTSSRVGGGGGSASTAKGFAIDGKRLAGARRGDGSHVNLLSMVEHGSGTTAAQREIPAKTNEVPEVTQLLAGVDVRGDVLTLDALHTQRGTAEAVVVDHHAAYLLMIKANQPNLLAAVAARFTQSNAFFQDAGRYFSQSTTGHGRSSPARSVLAAPRASTSRMLRRSSRSSAAARSCVRGPGSIKRWPSVSRRCPPIRPGQLTWPDTPKITGRWRTRATTCVMSRFVRTRARPVPDTHPRTSPRFETSSSARSAGLATSTSPTPEACTPTATNASSHSLASRHQKAGHTANTPGPWYNTPANSSVRVTALESADRCPYP